MADNTNGSSGGKGLLIFGSMVLGIILWGGFNTAMEATNVESFCISCHEMEENVYQEYQETIHFNNRTGVRATCPDCHVPKPWIHKMIRKIQASREVYSKIMGTVDTPEKFEEHRLRLATNVWRAMKNTDSRECRNCHSFEFMDLSMQSDRSADNHETGMEKNGTCIDCHAGIAHSLPEGYEEAVKELGLGEGLEEEEEEE
jgi:cytochrome c-type protein NapC